MLTKEALELIKIGVSVKTVGSVSKVYIIDVNQQRIIVEFETGAVRVYNIDGTVPGDRLNKHMQLELAPLPPGWQPTFKFGQEVMVIGEGDRWVKTYFIRMINENEYEVIYSEDYHIFKEERGEYDICFAYDNQIKPILSKEAEELLNKMKAEAKQSEVEQPLEHPYIIKLKELGAWEAFKKNFDPDFSQDAEFKNATTIQGFCKVAVSFRKLIANSFAWSTTEEEYDYWETVAYGDKPETDQEHLTHDNSIAGLIKRVEAIEQKFGINQEGK
jgi:hypothetical protein